jgi:hypothetical protein
MGFESPTTAHATERSSEWRRRKNREAHIARLERYLERLRDALESMPAQPGWFFHLKRWRLLAEIRRVEGQLERLRRA